MKPERSQLVDIVALAIQGLPAKETLLYSQWLALRDTDFDEWNSIYTDALNKIQ